MEVTFNGRTLTIDGRSFEHPHIIRDVQAWRDRVFVIYDYTEFKAGSPAANFICVDSLGNPLWTGENPTEGCASDAWVEFFRTEKEDAPFRIWNFACFNCAFNPYNGKLTEVVFTK